MESKWKEVELSDIVEMQSKKIDAEFININNFISTENMLPDKEGIRIAAGLPKQNNYLAFKKDDVLFSNIRTYFRKVWKASFDGGASNDVIVFRTKNSNVLNQLFLYHLIADERFIEFTVKTAKGTKMPRGDKSAMKGYKMFIPDNIPEQKAIAKILSSLDDKIELNRQMNKTLEQMAQAMFKSWFVDFDPAFDNAIANNKAIPEELKAKAEKRRMLNLSKYGNNKKPLPKEIQELFPDEFELTEKMGFVPKGWKVKIISDVADVVGGGTPSTKIAEYFCEKEIPWLSPKDLSGYKWKYISRGAKDITTLGLQKSSAKLMPKGTVLFSSRAPIGYIAIAENEVSTNQGFKSLIPKDKMNSEYLFYFLKSNLEGIEAIATGSTFKEVSGTAIKTFDITIPSIEILDIFKKEANDIGNKQLIIQKETNKLIKLRDTLLPKLISGELRVPKELIEKE